MAAVPLVPMPTTDEHSPIRQNTAVRQLFQVITPQIQSLSSVSTTSITSLTSLGATGTVADRYPYTTGAQTWTEGTITSYARTLLDDTTADIALATLTVGYGKFSVDLNNSDQTGLTGAAYNKIHFTRKVFDPDSLYDNVTNFRYTPLKAGYYHIGLMIASDGGTNDAPQANIYKNGNVWAEGTYTTATSSEAFSFISDLINFNGSTDYVEGFVYLPSGVTKVYGTTSRTKMFGWRVSP